MDPVNINDLTKKNSNISDLSKVETENIQLALAESLIKSLENSNTTEQASSNDEKINSFEDNFYNVENKELLTDPTNKTFLKNRFIDILFGSKTKLFETAGSLHSMQVNNTHKDVEYELRFNNNNALQSLGDAFSKLVKSGMDLHAAFQKTLSQFTTESEDFVIENALKLRYQKMMDDGVNSNDATNQLLALAKKDSSLYNKITQFQSSDNTSVISLSNKYYFSPGYETLYADQIHNKEIDFDRLNLENKSTEKTNSNPEFIDNKIISSLTKEADLKRYYSQRFIDALIGNDDIVVENKTYENNTNNTLIYGKYSKENKKSEMVWASTADGTLAKIGNVIAEKIINNKEDFSNLLNETLSNLKGSNEITNVSRALSIKFSRLVADDGLSLANAAKNVIESTGLKNTIFESIVNEWSTANTDITSLFDSDKLSKNIFKLSEDNINNNSITTTDTKDLITLNNTKPKSANIAINNSFEVNGSDDLNDYNRKQFEKHRFTDLLFGDNTRIEVNKFGTYSITENTGYKDESHRLRLENFKAIERLKNKFSDELKSTGDTEKAINKVLSNITDPGEIHLVKNALKLNYAKQTGNNISSEDAKNTLKSYTSGNVELESLVSNLGSNENSSTISLTNKYYINDPGHYKFSNSVENAFSELEATLQKNLNDENITEVELLSKDYTNEKIKLLLEGANKNDVISFHKTRFANILLGDFTTVTKYEYKDRPDNLSTTGIYNSSNTDSVDKTTMNRGQPMLHPLMHGVGGSKGLGEKFSSLVMDGMDYKEAIKEVLTNLTPQEEKYVKLALDLKESKLINDNKLTKDEAAEKIKNDLGLSKEELKVTRKDVKLQATNYNTDLNHINNDQNYKTFPNNSNLLVTKLEHDVQVNPLTNPKGIKTNTNEFRVVNINSETYVQEDDPGLQTFYTQRVSDIITGNKTELTLDNEGEIAGVRSQHTSKNYFDKILNEEEINKHKSTLNKLTKTFGEYYSTGETKAVEQALSSLNGTDLLHALDAYGLQFTKLIVDDGLTPRQAQEKIENAGFKSIKYSSNYFFDLFKQTQWDSPIEASPTRKWELLADIKRINRERLSSNRVKFEEYEKVSTKEDATNSLTNFEKSLKSAAEEISRDVIYKGLPFDISFKNHFDISNVQPDLINGLSALYESMRNVFSGDQLAKDSPFKTTIKNSRVDTFNATINRLFGSQIAKTKFDASEPLYKYYDQYQQGNINEQEFGYYSNKIYDMQYNDELTSKLIKGTKGLSDKDRNNIMGLYSQILRTPSIENLKTTNNDEYKRITGLYAARIENIQMYEGVSAVYNYLNEALNGAKNNNIVGARNSTYKNSYNNPFISYQQSISNAINSATTRYERKVITSPITGISRVEMVPKKSTKINDIYYYEKIQASKNNEYWVDPPQFSNQEKVFQTLLNNPTVKSMTTNKDSFINNHLNTYTQLLRKDIQKAYNYIDTVNNDVNSGRYYYTFDNNSYKLEFEEDVFLPDKKKNKK